MKASYILAGAAVAVLVVRKRRAASAPAGVRVGQLGEGAIVDGSNFTGTAWQRLSGADLVDPAARNLAAGAQADPGMVGQRQIGLMPGWDGTLA